MATGRTMPRCSTLLQCRSSGEARARCPEACAVACEKCGWALCPVALHGARGCSPCRWCSGRMVIAPSRILPCVLRPADGPCHAIAASRALSLRGSTLLSDAALHLLAQQRGSSLSRTSSHGSSTAGGGLAGSSSNADAGLVSLDISGCTGLTDQCWLAIVEASGLAGVAAHACPMDLAEAASSPSCQPSVHSVFLTRPSAFPAADAGPHPPAHGAHGAPAAGGGRQLGPRCPALTLRLRALRAAWRWRAASPAAVHELPYIT